MINQHEPDAGHCNRERAANNVRNVLDNYIIQPQLGLATRGQIKVIFFISLITFVRLIVLKAH